MEPVDDVPDRTAGDAAAAAAARFGVPAMPPNASRTSGERAAASRNANQKRASTTTAMATSNHACEPKRPNAPR